jgi:hypothetical protein
MYLREHSTAFSYETPASGFLIAPGFGKAKVSGYSSRNNFFRGDSNDTIEEWKRIWVLVPMKYCQRRLYEG